MFSAIRASIAAAAIAIVGLSAGAASAKTTNVAVSPNKLVLKLCKPHNEKHVRYLGIRKVHHKLVRVYRVAVVHVDARCHKTLVRVYKRYVPVAFHKKPVA